MSDDEYSVNSFEDDTVSINEEQNKKLKELIKKSVNNKLLKDTNDLINETTEVLSKSSISSSNLCRWMSAKNTHCKNKSNVADMCAFHVKVMQSFVALKLEQPVQCDTFEEIHIYPRSSLHMKQVVEKFDLNNKTVEVLLQGGYTEECKIHDEYIELLSDLSKFYYETKKGTLSAKKLKIKIIKKCGNIGIVCCNETNYCIDCYKTNFKSASYPNYSIL